MFKHEKQMLHPVKVDKPNPNYAAMLQEQLGGPQGELKAAMQYLSQSFRIKDPAIKDLFLDIGSEELSHMEIVAETIDFLLNREEAHNTMFREAFNKLQDTGSLKDWGITRDSKLYFDLSTPGRYFGIENPQPPSFNTPDTAH